ncbi:hypothetical protein ACW95P_00670 [Candidatus Mycoplasma pogonae]
MIYGKRTLDSIVIQNNNIYLNIVNYGAIAFEIEKGFPIIAAKAAIDEPLTYFAIIPKTNSAKIQQNIVNRLERYNQYKKYRKKVPIGIIFKSKNQTIESEFIELE